MRHPSHHLVPGSAQFCYQILVEPYSPRGPENVKITALQVIRGYVLGPPDGTTTAVLSSFFKALLFAHIFVVTDTSTDFDENR